MAVQGKNKKYKCFYCEKEYDKDQEADDCKQSHDLIYVPIMSTDLNRLYHFMFTKDDKMLTDSLVRTIRRFAKIAAKRGAK